MPPRTSSREEKVSRLTSCCWDVVAGVLAAQDALQQQGQWAVEGRRDEEQWGGALMVRTVLLSTV